MDCAEGSLARAAGKEQVKGGGSLHLLVAAQVIQWRAHRWHCGSLSLCSRVRESLHALSCLARHRPPAADCNPAPNSYVCLVGQALSRPRSSTPLGKAELLWIGCLLAHRLQLTILAASRLETTGIQGLAITLTARGSLTLAPTAAGFIQSPELHMETLQTSISKAC